MKAKQIAETTNFADADYYEGGRDSKIESGLRWLTPRQKETSERREKEDEAGWSGYDPDPLT